jgi:hypothetical protein
MACPSSSLRILCSTAVAMARRSEEVSEYPTLSSMVFTVPPVMVRAVLVHTAVATSVAVGAPLLVRVLVTAPHTAPAMSIAEGIVVVMVLVAAFQTAVAMSAAVGIEGNAVVRVRVAVDQTSAAISVAVGELPPPPPPLVRVLVLLLQTAAGICENFVSMLPVAMPSAARTLSAVRIAVPTVFPTGTPWAVDDAGGMAAVPVNSRLGPYTVLVSTLLATGYPPVGMLSAVYRRRFVLPLLRATSMKVGTSVGAQRQEAA